jgi:hypothetical protein
MPSRKHVPPETNKIENPKNAEKSKARVAKVSQIVPTDGKRFTFDYKYDFGDGWVLEAN